MRFLTSNLKVENDTENMQFNSHVLTKDIFHAVCNARKLSRVFMNRLCLRLSCQEDVDIITRRLGHVRLSHCGTPLSSATFTQNMMICKKKCLKKGQRENNKST